MSQSVNFGLVWYKKFKLKNPAYQSGIWLIVAILLTSLFNFILPQKVHAQTFTSSGTWTVPAGTTGAILEAWGGGGAGAGSSTNSTGGGGGAGGQYAKKTLSGLTVGNVYTVTVGSATSGGTGAGAAGSDSQVTNPSATVVVLAKGGAGGSLAGAGGTGSTANGIGDTIFAGGNGAAGSGSSATAGGGGGGAGSSGGGGNASGTTGGTGTASNGGNGGVAGSNASGSAGSNYGGAGGGGSKRNGGSKSGGNGAQGLVVITPITNSAPNTPTLSSPSSGATGISTSPSFTLSTTDPDSDYIEYRIYLYQSDCSTAISGSPFAQTSSQTGWSGQNANGNTAYSSGSTATYTYQGALSASTTYCWKADAIDPGGSNTYSSASATQTFTTGSSAAKIRQEINILDGTLATSSTSGSIVQLDTTQYSGTVSYYFEVVTASSSASTDTVTLTEDGTSTNDASITLAGTGANVRVRSTAFTPPSGQTEYVVKTGASHSIKAARIIVIQSGNPITSTETQIEIGDQETGLNNTTAAPLTNPKYWTYTAANWDSNALFFAEVTKAQSGTNFSTTVTLQQDDGTFNNWTNVDPNVANIVNADTSTAATRFRLVFSPTDGRHYRIVASESAANGGKNYSIYDAKIGIDSGTWSQVGNSESVSGFPDEMVTLSSTEVAANVYNGSQDVLTTYAFNGTSWVATGNPLPNNCGYGLTALTSTRIACIDVISYTLLAYDFNGTNWSQVGNAFSFPANPSGSVLTDLTSTSVALDDTFSQALETFSFDGTNWSQIGSGLSQSAGYPTLVTLTSTKIVLFSSTNETLTTYSWNGSSWNSVGNTFNTSNISQIYGFTNNTILMSTNTVPIYLIDCVFNGTNWTIGEPFSYTKNNQPYVTPLSATNVAIVEGSSGSWNLSTLAPSSAALTKLEPQYMLQNTADAGTGLQGYPELYDSTEWSGTTNTYYNVIDSNNASNSATLQDIDNGNANVTGSTATGTNQVFSSAMTMPTSGHQVDANVTNSTGIVAADRIDVKVVIGGSSNSPPNAPTLSSPASGATVTSVNPSLQMSTTDPDSDAVKYKVLIYSGTGTSGGNCSGTLLITGDQTSSGTGWDNGTTAYTSGATATYTVQTTLTGGSGYCWQAEAIDPGGSNTWSSLSSTSVFTVAPTTDQFMRGGEYFNSSGSKQPFYWAQ